MKSISASFRTHLLGEVTTLAELVCLRRRDGITVSFTTHDRDLVFNGVTYKSDGAYAAASRIRQSTRLKGDNYEVVGVLDSEAITQADLEAGLYDHARVDVYVCNWAEPSQGLLHVRSGWLGDVVVSEHRYRAAFRNLYDLLERRLGETYTPECRFCLGDVRCGVDIDALGVSGSVTGVLDERSFCDAARFESDGTFNDGRIIWTTGNNVGASQEINKWDVDSKTFTLWLPPIHPVSLGDGYLAYPGCDKRFATCKARFNNASRYGGFPHLPGLGRILSYPDARG